MSHYGGSNYKIGGKLMKYEEIKQDLFKTDKKYALGHCVAQDGGLGAGIAVQFCKLFGNR